MFCPFDAEGVSTGWLAANSEMEISLTLTTISVASARLITFYLSISCRPWWSRRTRSFIARAARSWAWGSWSLSEWFSRPMGHRWEKLHWTVQSVVKDIKSWTSVPVRHPASSALPPVPPVPPTVQTRPVGQLERRNTRASQQIPLRRSYSKRVRCVCPTCAYRFARRTNLLCLSVLQR